MKRVLTVDDSRAIRSIVSRQVAELGLEVEEAEDGVQGLSRLEECTFDLVLLDVTMPNLDGPGMLAKMRERGDKTPVLMLTSESKRSVVAQVMKLGIEDYILKPFPPGELRNKIVKTLRLNGAAASPVPGLDPVPAGGGGGGGGAMPAAPQPTTRPDAAVEGARQFIDLLVVDDMENVHKKLRSLIPQHITINAASSARASLTMCQERLYRVVFIDSDIPDVVSSVLMGQLRALQPHAAFLALCLRSANDVTEEMKNQGFDGAMFKPFDPGDVEDFLQRYFDNQDILSFEDNVLKVGPFSGREDRLERYFKRLGELIEQNLERVAAACYDDAILDLSKLPPRPDRAPRLVAAVDQKTKKMGLVLRLVGTTDVKQALSGFTDTSSLPFYDTVSAARNV